MTTLKAMWDADDEKAKLRADNERLRAALQGALSMVESFAQGPGFSVAGRNEWLNYRRALEPMP